MDALEISARGKIPMQIATALINGIDQRALETLIAEDRGLTSADEIEIARMNLVGGLRAEGFVVEGGRRGRGLPYRVTGFERRVSKQPATEWTGVSRDRLDWLHKFKQISTDDFDIIRYHLTTRKDRVHENAALYLWCYELGGGKNKGWVFTVDDQMCVVFQRFESQPRLKIFNIDMLSPNLLELARWLGPASTTPVQIVNVPGYNKDFYPREHGSWSGRKQAVYRTDEIVSNLRSYLSVSSYRRVQKRCEDTKFYLLKQPDPPMMRLVIDEWRRTNESKHRQLAITRDYVSLDTHCPGRVVLAGSRDGRPVSIRVMEVQTADRTWASELTGKDLNGADQLGGKSGTSDWMIYQQAKALLELGVTRLNVGADSGEGGLWFHKMRYTRPEDIVTSWTFATIWKKDTP